MSEAFIYTPPKRGLGPVYPKPEGAVYLALNDDPYAPVLYLSMEEARFIYESLKSLKKQRIL